MLVQSTPLKSTQVRGLQRLSAAASTAPTPASAPAATTDQVALSAAAQQRTPVQNLMVFGGDRKKAIETLIASGSKAENPQLGFFKNLGRKVLGFFGKTKTEKKRISAEQEIKTKVKLKNYRLENLSLTTTDKKAGVTRTVDFSTKRPGGGKGEVKHIGELIGKGTPTMLREQKIVGEKATGRQELNSYFDPKTGQKFLQATKQLDSKRPTNTIEKLGKDGKPTTRYTFEGSGRSARGFVENLNAQGEVTNSYRVSARRPEANYSTMLSKLSKNPPSSRADFIQQLKNEAPTTPTPAPTTPKPTPAVPATPKAPVTPPAATTPKAPVTPPAPATPPTPVAQPALPTPPPHRPVPRRPFPRPPVAQSPFAPGPCGCVRNHPPFPRPYQGYPHQPFGGNPMMMWLLLQAMMMAQMHGYSGAFPRY